MVNGKNCWEYMVCGREPHGSKADELGVCPAATEEKFDGINAGFKGGRFCWQVSGTLCPGKVQGVFASTIKSCFQCPFFREVVRQGGNIFIYSEAG
ncbi:MAG: hypothetical protein A2521_14330 [Deltaproteobacteria bacterium RIFOXYD12_FULL_57_12]|nr:MAG: hypothetical protein A2521_14330 [Deltaproteobacteria bacterium RIFOXYD12_FULL_57_12]